MVLYLPTDRLEQVRLIRWREGMSLSMRGVSSHVPLSMSLDL